MNLRSSTERLAAVSTRRRSLRLIVQSMALVMLVAVTARAGERKRASRPWTISVDEADRA